MINMEASEKARTGFELLRNIYFGEELCALNSLLSAENKLVNEDCFNYIYLINKIISDCPLGQNATFSAIIEDDFIA